MGWISSSPGMGLLLEHMDSEVSDNYLQRISLQDAGTVLQAVCPSVCLSSCITVSLLYRSSIQNRSV